MGHEVGHALNTPEAGWHNAIHDESGKPLGKFKGFLNVIEDARIEKLVKRKFPGLAKSFAAAYKGLYERDFFGIKNIDANKLNLIDRINIRYKIGAHVPVTFSDQERAFLTEIDAVETWDEVVDVARRVFAYCKDQEDSKIQSMDDLFSEIQQQQQENDSQFSDFEESADGEIEDENDDEYDDADSDLSEESDGSESEDSEAESSDESSQKTKKKSSPQHNSEKEEESSVDEADQDDGAPESVTDRNFRAREKELINESGEVFMIELPEADLSKIILQNHYVMDDLERFLRSQVADPHKPYGRNKISFDAVSAKCARKFNQNNKKFIMHLLKEFEMRKKAVDYARTQTAKTGELNMNSLHNYKFTNDLFKKISVVPKGKNHGMVLFLDMSGSMTNILRNTIEQCLVLVSFCRLAKIPFDVYGFSDRSYKSSGPQVNGKEKFKFSKSNPEHVGVLTDSAFHLKHLIGSNLAPKEYRRSFNNLCIVMNEWYRTYDYYRSISGPVDNDHGSFDSDWVSAGFGLNSTPFEQTLLASRDIINKFRAQHKLHIVNVIYLTDGEGNDGLRMPYTRKGVVYIVDKKTKKRIRVERNTQAALTELVREVTGCKHLGFYLANKYDVGHVCRDLENQNKIDALKSRDLKRQFREEKYFAVSNLGYDKYFYIESATTSISESELNIMSGMSKNKMANQFSKSLQSKKNNRALVTQFAEEIAASLKVA